MKPLAEVGVILVVMVALQMKKGLKIIALMGAHCSRAGAAPIIGEIMASNQTGIVDQDGDFADWLEIYNPDAGADNLAGWYLTNSATNLTQWTLPAVTIPSHGYLVVFCSSKNYVNPAQPLATNFNLSASGGYVALVEPNGSTVSSSLTFPVAFADISYGVSQPTNSGETAQYGYFAAATPGAANGNYTNILLAGQPALSAAAGLFTGSQTVTLSGATGSQHIRYALVAPSAVGLTTTAPTAASPLYTGPVTVNSTQWLVAEIFAADDSQHSLPASALYLQLDNTSANRLDTFASALPLIVFYNHGRGTLPADDTYYPGYFGAFSVGSGGTATLTQQPDFFTADTMKVHGYSSANFPKQSYDFDLADDLGGSVSEKTLGLDSSKSWVSVSAWYYDRTYIHNSFVYALGRSLGYWEPGQVTTEMFIHAGSGALDATSYAGITTVTDRLKVASKRINIESIGPGDVTAPAVTGGYVLKIDHPDPTAFTFTTPQGVAVELDTPDLDELVPAQTSYISGYVGQMETAMVSDAASGYATHTYLNFLDRPSWVDYHLLNVFVENCDAFQSSEYFTKDMNGLIKAGPLWDYDRSMDSADGRDANPYQWSVYSISPGFFDLGWWHYLTHDPDFMQAWVDRWQSLRLSTLATANFSTLADTLAAQVGPAAAARDAARWPDDVSRFTGGWQGEVDNMKQWLATRANWIDGQFVAQPGVGASAGGTVLIPPAGASVVYTLDGSDPRASGGSVSGSATVATGTVVLPAGQAFSARSYNVTMTTFPGSQWSAPVTAANGAALRAGAFYNGSCLALVGSGANTLIEGFTVTGTAGSSAQFLVRGVGPALSAFGVPSTLAQPVVSLNGSNNTLLATNAGWSTGSDAQDIPAVALACGAFALVPGAPDSALLMSLVPGTYTIQVTGAGGAGGTALAEVYQTAVTGSVVNISSRGAVAPSGGSLTSGFVITGGDAQVLIRGVGPALTGFGVTGVLSQAVLQVYDSGGRVVATNTGWSSNPNANAIAAAAVLVDAFALPVGSADSAVLLTLPPGAYSAVVTGGGGSSGNALAECYVVPSS